MDLVNKKNYDFNIKVFSNGGIRGTAAKPKMVLPPSEQHCLGGGVRALTAF